MLGKSRVNVMYYEVSAKLKTFSQWWYFVLKENEVVNGEIQSKKRHICVMYGNHNEYRGNIFVGLWAKLVIVHSISLALFGRGLLLVH